MLINRLDEKIKVRIMLLILFIVNVSWFSIFKFHTLMGDDLNAFVNFKSAKFWHYVFSPDMGGKFRPLYNTVQFGLFKLFGNEHILYYYLNLLFNFAIMCLFFKIILLVTRNNKYMAFLFSILFITARFAYYDIALVYGMMEALALLFFLIIIYNSILFYRQGNLKYLYWVLFYDLLIVFTHERYMILSVFIVLLVLLKTELDMRKRLLVLSLVPFIANIFLKKIIGISLTLGTGYTSLDFNIRRIVSFVFDGILNMFGFNIGPEHLAGLPFQHSSHPTQTLSLLLASLILVVVLIHVIFIYKFTDDTDKKRNSIIILLSLSLVGGLIAISSITVFQEFRWFYAPYVVVLIFLAHAMDYSIKNPYLKYFLLILIVVITIRNDNYYKKFMQNSYYIYSQVISDSAYNETIKKYGTHLSEYSVYIEKNSNLSWPLLGSVFFQVYAENPNIKINYVDHLPATKSDKDIFLKLDWTTKKLVSIR